MQLTGVQKTATSAWLTAAPTSSSPSSIALMAHARSRLAGWRPTPSTRFATPRPLAARPMEPPISPTPTMVRVLMLINCVHRNAGFWGDEGIIARGAVWSAVAFWSAVAGHRFGFLSRLVSERKIQSGVQPPHSKSVLPNHQAKQPDYDGGIETRDNEAGGGHDHVIAARADGRRSLANAKDRAQGTCRENDKAKAGQGHVDLVRVAAHEGRCHDHDGQEANDPGRHAKDQPQYALPQMTACLLGGSLVRLQRPGNTGGAPGLV